MAELTRTPPLTKLSEEEELFRDTVRDFAERDIRPRVAAMERASAIDPALLARCFELGLMGIDIPETYGGASGNLLMTVLAVMLGVAFVSGTLVFTDTIGTAFKKKSAKSYENVSIAITPGYPSSVKSGRRHIDEEQPHLTQRQLEQVRTLPGAASVTGIVSGYTAVAAFYSGFNESYYLLKRECEATAAAIVRKALSRPT